MIRTTRRTYGYPQNVFFDIVYNTNLIAVVVWSVQHRKLQKYSTWLKAIAETNQLQRCTTDTDCARVILGGSTKQTKFRDKMRPSNLREAYPQITYVSPRSIIDSCNVFKRMQNHHCIVWHNRYNIQYTKWFYHLLITYMNECIAPLAQCDPAAWPPVYIYIWVSYYQIYV